MRNLYALLNLLIKKPFRGDIRTSVDLHYFDKVVTFQEGVINMLWTILNATTYFFFLKRCKNPSSTALRKRFVLEFRSSLFETGNAIHGVM